MTYLVRQDGPDLYTVTKWDDGGYPENIYTCKYEYKRWSCTCPASHHSGSCKHPKIVQSWIKLGRKPTFVEEVK